MSFTHKSVNIKNETNIKDKNFKRKKKENSDYEIEYGYYKYEYPKYNLNIEYLRGEYIKKINEEFKNIFKTKIDIFDLYLYGISFNKNKDDPLICTNWTKDDLKLYIDDKVNDENIKKLNKISLYYIEELKKNIPKDNSNNDSVRITSNFKKTVIYYKHNYIELPNRLYKKIKSQYIQNDNRTNVNVAIFCALYRYKYLKFLYGIQGAVLPEYYLELKKINGTDVELFGSIINHTLKYYCGLFYDVEQDFGCIGNFFNIKLKKGFYVMNPPFMIWLMNLSFSKIINELKNSENKISIFLTIPVWDIDDRKKLNKKPCKKIYLTDYENNIKMNILRDSDYIIKDIMWCKEHFKYMDYFSNRFINFTSTNILVLSNNKNLKLNINFLPNNQITNK